MRIPPIMNVRVGNAYLNAYDISMSLLGVQEVALACNTHGTPLGTRHKAPCSSCHGVDRIVGTAWTRHASSVPGVAWCPGWEEGSVPRPSSPWST